MNEHRQEEVNRGFCEKGLGCRTQCLKAFDFGEWGVGGNGMHIVSGYGTVWEKNMEMVE